MNKKEISILVTYNFWANHRILKMCEHLSISEFIRAVTPDPSWGSLRGILVHLLDAEYGWRSILQSQPSPDVLSLHAFANIAMLQAHWSVEETQWLEYMADLREEALNQYINIGGPHRLRVWQAIVHVVNHGTQHRSEAAALLTGYGQSPDELDFSLFLSENPQYILE